ncbi:TniQ family protein [Hansschlegelia zhihuaiae]|uniref:TniQ domain-containing protein n=1 Tax=Hansschlegelia zhihuaiae TaxID=405005 RepID=A0A4Q0M583_9HYPH|nr:hypothetical protein EK403_20735 [Hansschlegelia zhihuaiae]
MKRLPLTVPLGHREAPSDFLSRLAVRNCIRDMRTLAHDLHLDVQAVICGESAALARLAEAGAADQAALEREAFAGSPRGISIFHRAHKFSRTIQLTRNQVRICPACFREDLDAQSFQAEARPYRRAHWIISQIKTCERHHLALAPLGGWPPPASRSIRALSLRAPYACCRSSRPRPSNAR